MLLLVYCVCVVWGQVGKAQCLSNLVMYGACFMTLYVAYVLQ